MTQAALAVMKRGGTIVNNCRLPLSAFSRISGLQRIEARGSRLYEYVAGRVASKWNSGDRADARRDRYRNLGHAVAEGAQAENDVPETVARAWSMRCSCRKTRPWRKSS